MQRPIITLTNDFGDRFATGQLESVVANINPDARFILASREVTPFSITEGAFIIQKFAPFTPKGSIHIGVVDPGVGSDRIGIIIRTTNFWFVGPNNGLFHPAASEDGIQDVYKINEQAISHPLSSPRRPGSIPRTESHSATFHGRDIFAKAAALLSLRGIMDDEAISFATQIPQSKLVPLTYQPNQVLHIDPYGNIKLNNPANYTPGDKLQVQIGGKWVTIPFVKTFADVNIGQPLAYKGSHETLEIAINQQNAAKAFRLNIEDTVIIK